MFWAIFAIIILICYVLFGRNRKRADFSGPSGWPYIGNALQIDPLAPHKTVTSWAKKYGGAYRITVFGDDIIIASSEEAIREILITKSDDFADRPYMFRIAHFFKDDIVWQNKSPHWSLVKRLSMAGLRMVGDGVQRLEDIASDILQETITKMEQTNGQPFDPKHLVHETICNINNTLIFGHRCPTEEEEGLLFLDQSLSETLTFTGPGKELDAFPWLRFFPNKTFKAMQELKVSMDGLYKQIILRTTDLILKGEADNECVVKDLITYQQKHDTDNTNKEITMTTLIDSCTILQAAGNITTMISIHALLAILASDIKLQERCQKEVAKVLGDRMPVITDRSILPFIESMVMELQRYLSHTPMAIPHLTTKDTSLLGKFVPKGTQVWVNLWHLHHSYEYWEDPWTFKPDRFLDENQKLVPPDHPLRRRLLPFGAGRRVCAGEAMARNRMFLIFATLLQKLTFLPEADGMTPPYDPRTYTLGVSIWPRPFKIRAIPRQ